MILAFVLLLLKYEQSKRTYSNFSIVFLAAMILVFFAGIRSKSIGVDTGNYIRYFLRFDLNQPLISSEGRGDYGFDLLQRLAKHISEEYWSLLFVIAAFAVYFTFKTLRSLSLNLSLSVFLYITLGTYLFFFNGARQGIAAAIYGVALIQILNRKFYKYILWVFVASLFHKTVLMMLPFYFVLRMKFSMKKMVLFSVISVLALLYISSILSLFDDFTEDRYGVYENRGAQGGYLLTFFYVFSASVLIYFRKFINEASRTLYDKYLYLTVFGALVYLVVTLTGKDVNFLRLSLYFSFGNMLIWPIVFEQVKFFKIPGIRLLFFLVHLVFYFIFLSKMRGYVPYTFNPSII